MLQFAKRLVIWCKFSADKMSFFALALCPVHSLMKYSFFLFLSVFRLLNPTENPTKSPLLEGDFICHTIPEFPGRLKTKSPDIVSICYRLQISNNLFGLWTLALILMSWHYASLWFVCLAHLILQIQYTLGRLSFGVFQPHNLVCTIRSVRQSIKVRKETKTGVFRVLEYPVMMDLTIHAPQGDLPAVVSHDAVCYECPKQPHRLKVTFKGSSLMPSREVLNNDELLAVWKSTFFGAYERAKKEQSIISKTLQSMITWWFKITLPNDEEMARSQDHSVHFEMKRSPRGHLDILYMSDTARITKGNRGTLVVVEPVATATSTSV